MKLLLYDRPNYLVVAGTFILLMLLLVGLFAGDIPDWYYIHLWGGYYKNVLGFDTGVLSGYANPLYFTKIRKGSQLDLQGIKEGDVIYMERGCIWREQYEQWFYHSLYNARGKCFDIYFVSGEPYRELKYDLYKEERIKKATVNVPY